MPMLNECPTARCSPARLRLPTRFSLFEVERHLKARFDRIPGSVHIIPSLSEANHRMLKTVTGSKTLFGSHFELTHTSHEREKARLV